MLFPGDTLRSIDRRLARLDAAVEDIEHRMHLGTMQRRTIIELLERIERSLNEPRAPARVVATIGPVEKDPQDG
jgi:hypothetical protein